MEPREGGGWFERDADGHECPWGRVIVWEPPARVVLAWQLDSSWTYDPELVTELEIRFTAEGPTTTRVELEHRDLTGSATRQAEIRASLDSADGWGGLLALYAGSLAPGG